MKVLFIHQAFVRPADAGGTRHYELFRYCAEKGCDFTVVTSAVSYLTGKRRESANQGTLDDPVSVVYAFSLPALHHSFLWRSVCFVVFMLSSVYQGLKQKRIDIVMGTTPPIFQSVSAWMVAALRQRPFILEVRDLWPEFAIDMGILKNPLLIALSRGIENFLYRRASHIVVNSPAYVDYLLKKKILPDKITLIANGVDAAMFDRNSGRTLIRNRPEYRGKFIITYTGALGIANDINTVIDAAHALKHERSIHFIIAGDGKEKVNLQLRAQKYQLANISFLGALAKDLMPALLNESDLCIATLQNIPMFTTTYPNKVFDYMAAGRPTILGIDGVIRKVIEESGGGIFSPPGDSDRLAKNIFYCYRHAQECARMGKSARAFVIRHFNRRDQAEKFYRLLYSLQ